MHALKAGYGSGFVCVCFFRRACPPTYEQCFTVLQMPEKPTAPMADSLARPKIKELTQATLETLLSSGHTDIDHMSTVNPTFIHDIGRIGGIPAFEPAAAAHRENARPVCGRMNGEVNSRRRGNAAVPLSAKLRYRDWLREALKTYAIDMRHAKALPQIGTLCEAESLTERRLLS
jgi:hypothetical protein